jgi:hypothetical protein
MVTVDAVQMFHVLLVPLAIGKEKGARGVILHLGCNKLLLSRAWLLVEEVASVVGEAGIIASGDRSEHGVVLDGDVVPSAPPNRLYEQVIPKLMAILEKLCTWKIAVLNPLRLRSLLHSAMHSLILRR